jgi:DNA-directed RNA polymerase specialized sigma24 family protein/CheY-like chemotaxis protein
MSLAVALKPEIPYLRRFARALTGNQRAGDEYVLATLETMVNSADAPGDLGPRIALYRVFLKIWSPVPINHQPEPDTGAMGATRAADRNLAAMTPLSRVAFLLHAVDGFTRKEIAQTLERPEGEVSALLDRAGREIAEQLHSPVLIIEDEPIISMELESIVDELGHGVIATARSHAEAIAAIADDNPGLVLADVNLADGSSGIDAVNEILHSVRVPVIFITGYPERLLTGERPEPAFLITKPFRRETVKAVISQALFFDQAAQHRWSAD